MDEERVPTASQAWAGSPGLTVEVDDAADPPVVSLVGELDAATVESFRAPAMDLVQAGHRRVVVDVADLTFVDSSGLNALVDLRRHLGDDGTVALSAPSSMLLRLLEVTALEEVFPVLG